MNRQILITGPAGVVGKNIAPVLGAHGHDVIPLDVRERGLARGDVRDRARMDEAIARVDGVIHLAAVSRVAWAEGDPALCRATNVGGLDNVLDAAARSPGRPWVIFASSREVYGEPESFPVDEDFSLRPLNVYGRSKAEGEGLVEAAREKGVRACVVRLSNVFGSLVDHADRVIPAFVRGAVLDRELRVDGVGHVFDFVHVDDVAAGLAALVGRLAEGVSPPPPVQFTSGVPVTLEALAARVIRLSGSQAVVRPAPPRDCHVSRFFGRNDRARRLLGWRVRVSLEAGLARLIRDFRDAPHGARFREVAP